VDNIDAIDIEGESDVYPNARKTPPFRTGMDSADTIGPDGWSGVIAAWIRYTFNHETIASLQV
jgi:hypothetical protein